MITARLLVTGGTFLSPISQWIIFFLVARAGGPVKAGEVALAIAISTLVFTFTNYGLRNGYITLSIRHSFADYFQLRVLGSVIGFVLTMLIVLPFHVSAVVALLVCAQKVVDSFLDILFAKLQRANALRPFGILMCINGVSSAVWAIVFYVLSLSPTWIIAASFLGSLTTWLIACVWLVAPVLASKSRQLTLLQPSAVIQILGLNTSIAFSHSFAVLIVNLPVWAVGLLGSPADVGRFAAAAYMITVGSLLGSSLNATMVGKYQLEVRSGRPLTTISEASKGNKTITFVGILGVFIVSIAGPWLFQMVYGPEFAFHPVELALVALAAALNPGTQLINAALLALNLYRKQLSIMMYAVLGTLMGVFLGAALGWSGFLIGATTALIGSAIKYILSMAAIMRTRRQFG